jgi:hypothetical protein
MKPAKVAICPCCGFKPEVQNKVKARDGELVEFTSRSAIKPANEIERQAFYAELKSYSITRNYNPGWKKHKFREKFGFWPNGLDHIPPSPPSPTTLSWIRSRQIAWAKASGRRT